MCGTARDDAGEDNLRKPVGFVSRGKRACMQTCGMWIERRREPRVPMVLPLRVGDGLVATTRDISPSGLYFEIPDGDVPEGTLHFEMDLEEANMKFTARGTVVRVERRDGITGVAVKLFAGRLVSIT